MSISAFTSWDFNNKQACINALVTQINTLAGTSIAQIGIGGQSVGFLSSLNALVTAVNTAKSLSIPLFTGFDEGAWLQQANKYIALLHATGAPF